MGGALRHTVVIKLTKPLSAVQASVILDDVGAVLLELYSAKERRITRPVKACQGKTNFHEHML